MTEQPGYARCRSASSTTASTPTRSAGPSAGTATSPSGWRERSRGHLSHAAAVGARSERTVAGVHVVAVSPRMALYRRGRRRRILPPLLFGLGVLWHLVRRGRQVRRRAHGVVPVLPAARCGAPSAGEPVPAVGRLARGLDARVLARISRAKSAAVLGWRIQRACLRVPQRLSASRGCMSSGSARRRTQRRADAAGGAIPGTAPRRAARGAAGRGVRGPAHPREARARARACSGRGRRQIPGLRGEIYGDGPDRTKVLRAIARVGLDGDVEAPGFVDAALLEEALATALCLVLPSRREGYGLVVIEAAARGRPGGRRRRSRTTPQSSSSRRASTARSRRRPTPPSCRPQSSRVHDGGAALRESTADWFRRNADRLSFERSFAQVLETYDGSVSGRAARPSSRRRGR